MKSYQKGFGLILLIGGLVLILAIISWYFIRTGDESKSQLETGQEAINQATEINNRSAEQAKQLNQELELQSEISAE